MKLTFSQYAEMSRKARLMSDVATTIEDKWRWLLVVNRILLAMTNPVIFAR